MCETKLTKSDVKKMKEDNIKPKEAVPSKIEKVSELQTLCREELFCEDVSKTSEKARKW
jgi:hypothetical protein